jgi:peptide/nickel transport system permease protein
MLIYIARRLVWTAIVILVVLFLTFLVFYKLPAGDPALTIVGRNPTQENIALARERLHLDEPFYEEFGYFVWHFVRGDEHGWPGLGYSYTSFVPVKEQIAERAPRTLWLVAGAAAIWLIVGVAIGVVSAVKRRSAVDRVAMGFVLIGTSAPVFWLGLIALWIFWRELGWTAGTGYTPISEGVGAWFSHMILPWCVLALLFAAIYARLTRNNLLETLGEDYIRTARAKGLSERVVIFKHGLRASLTPIVTQFGLDVALLIGGAVITETIFDLQGLGWLAINSQQNKELPTVLGVVVVTATAVAVMNLVVDIAYAFLDPRVRYT